MIVKEVIDKKVTNKHIRILSATDRANCGKWYENGNEYKVVKSVKATKYIIFLFV